MARGQEASRQTEGCFGGRRRRDQQPATNSRTPRTRRRALWSRGCCWRRRGAGGSAPRARCCRRRGNRGVPAPGRGLFGLRAPGGGRGEDRGSDCETRDSAFSPTPEGEPSYTRAFPLFLLAYVHPSAAVGLSFSMGEGGKGVEDSGAGLAVLHAPLAIELPDLATKIQDWGPCVTQWVKR